ncbi:hypothetical protein ACEQPO_22265 [Bacillus sp. SL00103]
MSQVPRSRAADLLEVLSQRLIGVEIGKLVSGVVVRTDIILTPLVTIITGFSTAT